MDDKIYSHKDLIVWQKAMDFVAEIYKCTESFPKQEIYGLVSQMRRAAVSIPSNIAEGRRRGSVVEFLRFLRIAFGSGAELETQLEIARRLDFLREDQFFGLNERLGEVLRMLNKMTRVQQKPPLET